MITVLFFAQIRERLGEAKLELDFQEWKTANDLRVHLCQNSDKWAKALSTGKLLVAVNQELCSPDQSISDGDEVAFFPPVTGG